MVHINKKYELSSPWVLTVIMYKGANTTFFTLRIGGKSSVARKQVMALYFTAT
jgi:hypothetical protein